MLPEVKTGALIRKRKHPAPPLHDINPNFGVEYDEEKHGDMLRSDLDVSHLTPDQQTTVTNLIKKYWRVFCKEGVTTPVKDYECEIDTGDAKPIACRNATFGPRELPIIEKAIAKLLDLDHIEQIYEGDNSPSLPQNLIKRMSPTLTTSSGDFVSAMSPLTLLQS